MLTHDPTSEEATSALMRLHSAQGKPALVDSAYQRCRAALEGLGLRTSPALEEVREATNGPAPFSARQEAPPAEMPIEPRPVRLREERRLVSVFFAEVSAPAGFQGIDLEDLRDMVGMFVSQLIAEVERLGGTVTSVSGAGLSALFGAPVSHEDDPERAVRAAYRALSRPGGLEALSLRVGIETGPAIVGPIGDRGDYGAVGEVVSAAAAIQSVAKPGSALIGPQHAPPRKEFLSGGRRTKWRQTLKQATGCFIPQAAETERHWLAWSTEARWSCSPGRPRRATDGARRSGAGCYFGRGFCGFYCRRPGLGKSAWSRSAGSASWPGWVAPQAGCRSGWRDVALHSPRQRLMASTNNFSMRGSAWCRKRAKGVRPALERAMRAVFGGESDHIGSWPT